MLEKLQRIQSELKAPKKGWNNFGNYKYRSAEHIIEAVKPYLEREGLLLTLSDELVMVGDRYYIKATATIVDIEGNADKFSVSAFARESVTKKGMDDSQVTGATSSYARKYALNGLFLLDDTKDADTDENRKEREARAKKEIEKAPEPEKTHITETEAKTVEAILTKRKVSVEAFCKHNNIKTLYDMTPENYVQFAQVYGEK